MINFYGSTAENFYTNPNTFLVGTVSCVLLPVGYVFNPNHTLADIPTPISNPVFLTSKRVIDDGDDLVFDAADLDFGPIPANVAYGSVLFMSAIAPLFILRDVTGLPGVSSGGLVAVSFSSAVDKIFRIKPNYSFTFGTHFSYPKDPISQPTGPSNPPTRPGGNILSSEAAPQRTLSGKDGLYKDIAIRGKPHPLTGDLTTVSGADSINQALRMIILSNTGDRPFSSRRIAGDVKSVLFEPGGVATTRMLQAVITRAINNHEPRVMPLSIDVTEQPEKNGLVVRIVYRIVTTGVQESFSIFLERV